MQENIFSLLMEEHPDGYTSVMGKSEIASKREPSEFGARIAEARRRAGLTQVELARRLGVTQQVVAAWERRNVALRAE